jgi:hypothetical protein
VPLLSLALGAKYNPRAAGPRLPWDCSCPAWLPAHPALPPMVPGSLAWLCLQPSGLEYGRPAMPIHLWHIRPGPGLSRPVVLSNCRGAHPVPSVLRTQSSEATQRDHQATQDMSQWGIWYRLPPNPTHGQHL